MTVLTRSPRTALIAALLAGSALAQSTTRVSVGNGGVQGNIGSEFGSISADGRFVAFDSLATNLVAGDLNGVEDSFLLDRQTGVVALLSLTSAGAQGNGQSGSPMITPDGRYVAFWSIATNLVAGDTNSSMDVFLRDRQLGTTERVSLTSTGGQVFGHSLLRSVSADARFVVFETDASNVVPGDTNLSSDVFVRDRFAGTTECVSVDSSGALANLPSQLASISGDGRWVAFESLATNLVSGDTNGMRDVFVHDRQTGATEIASISSGGAQGNQESRTGSISADGRFVVFSSSATNLVAGGTNGLPQIFVRDRQTGTTALLTTALGGAQPNGASDYPIVSPGGRFVVFQSAATNLVVGDANAQADVFLRDRANGTTELVDVSTAGVQSNSLNSRCTLSPDGRFAVFQSLGTTLVAGDTNGVSDVFLRDRGAPPPGTDLCQPGVAGVIGCPCSNPPASAPRGCDNSSASGGAQLASSGTSSLAADTLVFTTNGELANATSILLEGSLESVGGVVFGQGVRCAGGRLLRLYVKTAAGGSITAPAPGDPGISARSAALGDALGPLSIRWYAVYYGDPTVLGGCPAANTFNITQTQRLTWIP
jgi:Tol biopolymer transport system component